MVKKLLLAIIAALLLMPCAAYAASGAQVIDDAGIITPDMEQAISAVIDETELTAEEKGRPVDIVVLTTYDVPTDNSYSMTGIRDYADDYYDYNGYGAGSDYSGMLFLVDMNNRAMWISTCGSMISTISQSRIDAILDAAYNDMHYGDYGDAILHAMQMTDGYLFNRITAVDLLIAAGAAIAVVLVIVKSVSAAYSLKGSTYSYSLNKNASCKLTRDEEHFLRQHVTRTARSTGGGSSGGGGGVHRSSSGRSHGGGGRRF